MPSTSIGIVRKGVGISYLEWNPLMKDIPVMILNWPIHFTGDYRRSSGYKSLYDFHEAVFKPSWRYSSAFYYLDDNKKKKLFKILLEYYSAPRIIEIPDYGVDNLLTDNKSAFVGFGNHYPYLKGQQASYYYNNSSMKWAYSKGRIYVAFSGAIFVKSEYGITPLLILTVKPWYLEILDKALKLDKFEELDKRMFKLLVNPQLDITRSEYQAVRTPYRKFIKPWCQKNNIPIKESNFKDIFLYPEKPPGKSIKEYKAFLDELSTNFKYNDELKKTGVEF